MRRLALGLPLVLAGCAAQASDPMDHILLLDGTSLDGEIQGVSDGAFLLRVGDEVQRIPLDEIDEVQRATAATYDAEDLDKPRVRPGFNIGLVGVAADVEVELDRKAFHSVGVRAGVGLGINGYYIVSGSAIPQVSGYGVFYAQLIRDQPMHVEGSTGPSVLYDSDYAATFLAWEGGVAFVADITEHLGVRAGVVGSTPLLWLTPQPEFNSAYAIGFRPESAVTFRW